MAKRKHRAPLHRRTAILIAALIAMMALSVTAFASEFIQNWFVSFFAEKSNSALTQEQVNYIEENAQNINEVQTQDNWNVELKSAITDGDIAYIVIGVTAPEGVSLEQIHNALETIPANEVAKAKLMNCGEKETCITTVLLLWIRGQESRRMFVPAA